MNEFSKGDSVSVSYTSSRSENVVSRSGTVQKTPDGGKRGFFVKTGEGQLTAIVDEEVYSVTIDTEGGKWEVTRTTHLGELDSVSEA